MIFDSYVCKVNSKTIYYLLLKFKCLNQGVFYLKGHTNIAHKCSIKRTKYINEGYIFMLVLYFMKIEIT